MNRSIFKVNSLLQDIAIGTSADIGKLCATTEHIAQLNPREATAFEILFDEVEELLADL